jgi:glycine C-acetyltransferase/8-amino-7-oxononanoate synthase
MNDFNAAKELDELKQAGLYRQLKTIGSVNGPRININGKEYINFSSNDYLGLSQHPAVKAAASQAIEQFGYGAGASRLISGNTRLHEELEERIAGFKGREAALGFSSGYQANLGIIPTLVDDQDTIIIDRLNHASIIDACRLSKAKLQVYPHKDMKALKKVLERSTKFRRRLIVTDSVFSMDGDIAPLPEIVALAKHYGALTMIDEAHATGTIGSHGKGGEEYFGIEGQVDIIMGTFSKALGSSGGFVAGSRAVIELLRNRARSFIYTTAPPPAACAATLAALNLLENDPDLLRQLWLNIEKVSQTSETAIIPIIIGPAEKTMELAAKAQEKGVLLSAIRPPTVPEGESRLRITITAAHQKEELECLASLLPELTPA